MTPLPEEFYAARGKELVGKPKAQSKQVQLRLLDTETSAKDVSWNPGFLISCLLHQLDAEYKAYEKKLRLKLPAELQITSAAGELKMNQQQMVKAQFSFPETTVQLVNSSGDPVGVKDAILRLQAFLKTSDNQWQLLPHTREKSNIKACDINEPTKFSAETGVQLKV